MSKFKEVKVISIIYVRNYSYLHSQSIHQDSVAAT